MTIDKNNDLTVSSVDFFTDGGDNAISIIDTHAHLDGPEFKDDIDNVIARARKVGIGRFLSQPSTRPASARCRRYARVIRDTSIR